MRNLQGLIPRDRLDAVGICTAPRCDAIRQCVLQSNAQLCVEIGVWKGSSLMCFAEALEVTGGRVIGIDPYLMDAARNKIGNKKLENLVYEVLVKDQSVRDGVYENLKRTIQDHNLGDTIMLVRERSENYSACLDPESVDVLHIDGNHNEECVSRDIKQYLPLVKPGGYVVMDDVRWPPVAKAIRQHLLGDAALERDLSFCAVYRKRPKG